MRATEEERDEEGESGQETVNDERIDGGGGRHFMEHMNDDKVKSKSKLQLFVVHIQTVSGQKICRPL